MRLKLLTFFFCCLFVTNTFAQAGKLFNTDRQLSSSLINCIYQDRNGYVWICTHNGLSVYDGYQFFTFNKEDKNSGLSGNVVNCIVQGSGEELYVGLSNGLQIFSNDHFKDIDTRDVSNNKITCYVNCICPTRGGDILVGTSGYGILRLHNKQMAKQMAGLGHKVDFVKKMAVDRQGNVWIATQDNGICKLSGNKLTAYSANGASATSFMDICQDLRGDIYAATNDNGLYRLDRAHNVFIHVQASGNLPIATMKVSANGKILLGSNGAGLYFYDPQNNMMLANAFYSNEIDLGHSKVYSIVEDNSGNVWMGLLQKGVFVQPVRPSGFEYVGYKSGATNSIGDACVMCVKYLKDGSLCVATDNNGLYLLDKNRKLKRHYAPGSGSTGIPSTILGIAEDYQGRIWAGSFINGCGWINPASGDYHQLPCTFGKASSVFDVATDSNGNLWIGTMGDGLKKVNLHTNAVTEYRNSGRGGNELANNYIAQISLSHDGKRLYVGTTTGLSCLDLINNSWLSTFKTNVIVKGEAVGAIKEDLKGNIWTGTSDGLYCISADKRHIKKYTEDDGLAGNSIASIETDSRGGIWVSTNHGMSCLTPTNHKIVNYYAGDGLQGNEFSEGVSSCNADGIMVFGGMGGISIFNPMKMHQQRKHLSVWLTNFAIGGESVVAGMKSGIYTITDTTAMYAKTFELNHQDNSFSINLSTLTYDNPGRITFLYSMNGEKWTRLPQGRNDITFSHLPSGTYKFRVKALDNGVESDVKEFTVEIHPAWYFSVWAKIFYFLILALIVFWYLRMRQRKEQDRLRLQEHIHAEEMSEAKLRFFMNISHEIRTPMTLIVAPLLSLLKDDKDPQRQGVYKTIKRNAERILNLINQMMDLRKIDKGQMVMRMSETDLIAFTADIYNLFAQQAKTKSISFKFEHDSDTLNVWIDRGNFDKVLMNILSNAFKFTPSGGKITISITHDEHNVSIIVSDDGEIIPEDKLEKIFQRFYQTTSVTNDRQAGTGIGLDLTRSLVELHHGTITAANNADGKGCSFTVTIPMGCAHLKSEEMVTYDNSNSDSPLYGIEDISDEEENAVIEAPHPQTYNKKRPTIVVVEDDTEIRTYLKSELGNEYTVIECCDGREALPVILKEIPALVISDIMMPEMDGNTLCTKIKSNVNTNQIPVILLTAKNRDEDKLEGLETGADAYIVKPFNLDILRRTIVNLLNARNLLRNKFTGNESQEKKVDDIQIKSPDERLLERVMAVINKNIDNSELSVDLIADEVGISRVHLHRKMKELTNQTPHDFIRNIRLKQAANLLANQHQNVTEVMYACGFNNSASFSTMFKNMYGMSPREYMKEHLQMI
jgi:signal transduction histidine kinase/DNA-binding response OmpR family regulator/ligand-binding sensor domain-containing protein